MTKKRVEEVQAEPPAESLEDDVIEIDTDQHFGRVADKVQAADAPTVDTNQLEDDLLYDLC